MDLELKLMELVDYIEQKIKELEDCKERNGNPDDIWDEVSNSCDLRLEAYRDVLNFIKEGP